MSEKHKLSEWMDVKKSTAACVLFNYKFRKFCGQLTPRVTRNRQRNINILTLEREHPRTLTLLVCKAFAVQYFSVKEQYTKVSVNSNFLLLYTCHTGEDRCPGGAGIPLFFFDLFIDILIYIFVFHSVAKQFLFAKTHFTSTCFIKYTHYLCR
jgi:hypothetical protein